MGNLLGVRELLALHETLVRRELEHRAERVVDLRGDAHGANRSPVPRSSSGPAAAGPTTPLRHAATAAQTTYPSSCQVPGPATVPASTARTVQPDAFGRLEDSATSEPTQLPAG